MGKILLCDGQVHGNDVDEIGWSVFTCLLSLRWLISHGRVRTRPNSGLVCKCYALSEHAPPRAKLISPLWNGDLINKSRISLARLFQKRLKVEHTSWSTKNKGCNRNGFGNYLASFSWSRDTSKITLGKILLCDGQVHGNDVDEIGWSVFTCLRLKVEQTIPPTSCGDGGGGGVLNPSKRI